MAHLNISQEVVKSGSAARKTYLKIMSEDSTVIGYIQPTYLDFGMGFTSHKYIAYNMSTHESKLFSTPYDACMFLNINPDDFCYALPKNWDKERVSII